MGLAKPARCAFLTGLFSRAQSCLFSPVYFLMKCHLFSFVHLFFILVKNNVYIFMHMYQSTYIFSIPSLLLRPSGFIHPLLFGYWNSFLGASSFHAFVFPLSILYLCKNRKMAENSIIKKVEEKKKGKSKINLGIYLSLVYVHNVFTKA